MYISLSSLKLKQKPRHSMHNNLKYCNDEGEKQIVRTPESKYRITVPSLGFILCSLF